MNNNYPIEERSNSFFEEMLYDDPMADFPKLPPAILQTDDIKRDQPMSHGNLSHRSYEEQRELSYYAV